MPKGQRNPQTNLLWALTKCAGDSAAVGRPYADRAEGELRIVKDMIQVVRRLRSHPGDNEEKHYFTLIDTVVRLERLAERPK